MAFALTNGTVAAEFSTSTPRNRKLATSPVGKGWLARLVDATFESRMRKAERELRRHRHLLRESDAFKNELSPDSLPFGR